MSEIPTPETDAYCLRAIGFPTGYEWREFARNLERQRDEARDQLTRICREGFGYQDTISLEPCADYVLRKLNEERKLARELRVHLMNLIDHEPCKCCYDDQAETDWAEAQSLLAKAKEVIP